MSKGLFALQHIPGQCTVKIPYLGYEISLAFDDSCDGGKNKLPMHRCSLKVFESEALDAKDLTKEILYVDEMYSVASSDLLLAFKLIKEYKELQDTL